MVSLVPRVYCWTKRIYFHLSQIISHPHLTWWGQSFSTHPWLGHRFSTNESLFTKVDHHGLPILCLIQRTTVTSLNAPTRTHAARRILYASIPVFLFLRVRKHTSCAQDYKRLPPEYVLMSRSFSRWDKSIVLLLEYVAWEEIIGAVLEIAFFSSS